MATMSVKKPEKQADEIMRVDQRRPALNRFRLQVASRQPDQSILRYVRGSGEIG